LKGISLWSSLDPDADPTTNGIFNALVSHNTITGTDAAGTIGIQLIGNVRGATVTQNDVSHVDTGFKVRSSQNAGGSDPYSPTSNIIDHNKFSKNLGDGILLTAGSGNTFDNNEANDNGHNGIEVTGNTGDSFTHNSAHHNAAFDLYWDNTGSMTFKDNHCGTASPSKAVWDAK
jgi:parallel beta-helix repeat protein